MTTVSYPFGYVVGCGWWLLAGFEKFGMWCWGAGDGNLWDSYRGHGGVPAPHAQFTHEKSWSLKGLDDPILTRKESSHDDRHPHDLR